MEQSKIYPIILCGGSGTRLWPVSRKSMPKQFGDLLGEETLFQETCRRFDAVAFASPTIVTNEQFRFTVKDQLAQIGIAPEHIVLEPAAKNTAPAALASAMKIAKIDANALILILPSDHSIKDIAAFRSHVQNAAQSIEPDQIVTFGVVPSRPETGYGYLELAQNHDKKDALIKLNRFVEKPDLKTAQAMVEAGHYLWNAGIFLARADTLIKAFQTYAKAMFDAVSKACKATTSELGFVRPDATQWAQCPADSIDYAIMEKYHNLAVMPVDVGWSDLGDWNAVWQSSLQNENGVALRGAAMELECHNSLLRSDEPTMQIVGIGLNDIFAVATKDAVVVGHMDRAQDVKLTVESMKALDVPQAEQSLRDSRPWGWYEVLVQGPRFQVKRIVVHPGASLSLQSHYHRAEHWTVVEGSAVVTVDDKVKLIGENESVFVPLGAIHRLENPGKVPLTLIEVQSGSYLGEDDIVRYEDNFGRS